MITKKQPRGLTLKNIRDPRTPETAPISVKQLILELNTDLKGEYAAAIQYTQHASVITGAQYDFIQKELKIHAAEEMHHAAWLSDQIESLGGTPTTDIGKRESASDAATLLTLDLRSEEDGIARYKTRIAQAEQLHEYGLRRVLEDILVEEEEHKRDLLMAIAA